MNFKNTYWLITAFFIFFSYILTAQSQTPGGVESPLYWFVTIKDNTGKTIWKDDDNTRKTILMEQKNNSRNINFHDAYSFDGKQEIVLHNTKINQLSIVAPFYPQYDSSLKLISDQFYSVLSNDTPIYKFTSTTVDIDKSSLSDNFILSYNRNFTITTNSELNKSMKIGSYTFSRLSNNLNNPWGEVNETKIKFNFKGYIPEFLFYGRVLTIKELNRIHSYLAIKYGLTIDTNYYNSNDDIIWDPIINKTFHNRVSAIGKDISGSIYQSKSNTTYEELYSFSYDADSGNRSVTIGFKESDYQNLPDKSFLFWGDNNTSYTKKQANTIYKTEFIDLWISQRKWMMQNDNSIKLSTSVKLGNPLITELEKEIAKPTYYLIVIDDDVIELKDIHPFNIATVSNEQLGDNELSNFKWNSNSKTEFSFAAGEKLRFMVKSAKDRLFNPIQFCNEAKIEIPSNIDLTKLSESNGFHYFKGESILGNCIYRVVYHFIKNRLVLFIDGGIGKYTYTIKDNTNVIVKKGILDRLESKEYTISPIELTKQKKYNLVISDETNQTIELILAIK